MKTMFCCKKSSSLVIFMASLMLFFSGCNDTGDDYVSIRHGQFLDTAVQGLTYTSGGQTGLTDSNGAFVYETGQDLSFKIGNIPIGYAISSFPTLAQFDKIPETVKIYPSDLIPATDNLELEENERIETINNMLIFLQTMDEDLDPENNAIYINDAVLQRAAAIEAPSDLFKPSVFASNGQEIIDQLFDDGRQLISKIKAKNHFKKTMLQTLLNDFRSEFTVPGVTLAAESPCPDEYTPTECEQGTIGAAVTYVDNTPDDDINGNFVWQLNSGYTDLENQIPVTNETRFRIASVTKSFTAHTLLILIDEAVWGLTLDDTLEKWLPGLLPDGIGEQITIRNVLNHSSDIYNFYEVPSPWFLDYLFDPTKQYEPEDLINIAIDNEDGFFTGDGWHYSNTNYVLTGMIIEAVTGSSWESIIWDHIIIPYELNDTIVPLTGEAYLVGPYTYGSSGQYADGHINLYDYTNHLYGKEDAPLEKHSDLAPSSVSSSANMISSSADLLQWIKLIGKGSLFSSSFNDQIGFNSNPLDPVWFDLSARIPGLIVGPNVFNNTDTGILAVPGNFAGYDSYIAYKYQNNDNISIATLCNRTIKNGNGTIRDQVALRAIDILAEDY